MAAPRKFPGSADDEGTVDETNMDGRELRARRTREKIRHAAGALLVTKGLDQTSVKDIIAAAGVAKGTFYKHFAGKEALIQEFVGSRFQTAFELLPGFLELPSAREASLALITAILKGREWQPELLRVVLGELAKRPGLLPSRDLHRLALPIVELGVRTGELRTDIRAPAMASFVADAIYAALRHWGEEILEGDLEEAADTALILAWDAIRVQQR